MAEPSSSRAATPDLKAGDLVFQTSRSAQSRAIRQVTGSPYSHVGIVFIVDNKAMVLEAVEPVKLTSYDAWVRRGARGRVVVKRLRDRQTLLTAATLDRMWEIGRSFLGLHYDSRFEWGDDRLYCSELVYKIYLRGAGVKVGRLERFSDLDLSGQAAKALIRRRYPEGLPMAHPVVTPAALFEDPALEPVPL
jgi:hypothetical protein